jgi:hypothetical protein
MTTARSYLQPLVRESWLDLVRDDVIDPSLPIIDAHHHIWNDRAFSEGGTGPNTWRGSYQQTFPAAII